MIRALILFFVVALAPVALYGCASAPEAPEWGDLIREATPEILPGPCPGVRWSRQIAAWETPRGTIEAHAYLELREVCAEPDTNEEEEK